jgi:hypothetical protein
VKNADDIQPTAMTVSHEVSPHTPTENGEDSPESAAE